MTETDTPTAVLMDEPTAAVHGPAAGIDGPEGLDRTMKMNLKLNYVNHMLYVEYMYIEYHLVRVCL